MRAAKRADYRRRLTTRPFRLILNDFAAPTLTTVALQFSSPITVICGPNGAGKTRLLKGLAQTLGCGTGHPGVPLAADSQATLRYRFGGAENNLTYSAAAGHRMTEGHGRPYLLEPPHYAMAVLSHLRQTDNISELLEAYAPTVLSAGDVERLSFLINRRYQEVKVYEIDDPGGPAVDEGENDAGDGPRDGVNSGGPPVPLPYFQVTSFGRVYGSESMGLGELSMFCLWWNLSRVEQGSILLIDEPEAFASPHSQYAFVDELVVRCVERELTVIVSTQSHAIIDSLDAGQMRVLIPGQDGVSVLPSPAKSVLLNTLGVLVPKSGLLLAEDRLAARVIAAAVGTFAADLLQVIEVEDVDGTGPLEAALRMPRLGNRWFHLVGVFDGDQRTVDRNGLQWPREFLPGNHSPEAEMRAIVSGQEVEAADALGRTVEQLRLASAGTAGLEHHDWLPAFAAALGLAEEQVVTGLLRLWMANEHAAFEALVASIRAHFAA
jgi:predicted ATPase